MTNFVPKSVNTCIFWWRTPASSINTTLIQIEHSSLKRVHRTIFISPLDPQYHILRFYAPKTFLNLFIFFYFFVLVTFLEKKVSVPTFRRRATPLRFLFCYGGSHLFFSKTVNYTSLITSKKFVHFDSYIILVNFLIIHLFILYKMNIYKIIMLNLELRSRYIHSSK